MKKIIFHFTVEYDFYKFHKEYKKACKNENFEIYFYFHSEIEFKEEIKKINFEINSDKKQVSITGEFKDLFNEDGELIKIKLLLLIPGSKKLFLMPQTSKNNGLNKTKKSDKNSYIQNCVLVENPIEKKEGHYQEEHYQEKEEVKKIICRKKTNLLRSLFFKISLNKNEYTFEHEHEKQF